MTDRDELANLIGYLQHPMHVDELGPDATDQYYLAEAIVAAGWVKPSPSDNAALLAERTRDKIGYNVSGQILLAILSQAPTPSVLQADRAATLRAAADEMDKTGMFIVGTYANEWLRARADALDTPTEGDES